MLEEENILKVTLVASALVEHGGKYLLVQQARSRRQPGKWGPPGGKPDVGETLPDAAVRESRAAVSCWGARAQNSAKCAGLQLNPRNK